MDIALINTFGYLLLESAPYDRKPSVVLKVKEGAQDNYTTSLVAPVGFPVDMISKITSVAGTTQLMLVAVGSTSGNLVPPVRTERSRHQRPGKGFCFSGVWWQPQIHHGVRAGTRP